MASAASQSLAALLRRTTINDHEELLQAANAALEKSAADSEAQHVKVVALLKLDRFDDALRVFEEYGDQLKQRAPLEHAYALYKSGKLEEAEAAADKPDGSRGMKHVLAQASYRAENFEQAARIYRELAAKESEVNDEEGDLRINSSAVDAQLEWVGKGDLARKKRLGREDLEAFETTFNAACGSIAKGEFGQGEVLLRRAIDLCNASEDLSEEEKKAETLPIIVQQIYVLSKQDRIDEARQLISQISISEIQDVSTRHIAQVNALIISSNPPNPYLSHRMFNSYPTPAGADHPFDFQSSILRQNSYAMELGALKHKGVFESTTAYIASKPSPTLSADVNSISTINAAARAKQSTGKAALKEILPLLEQRPNDVGLLLTIIQLYVLTNNSASAIQLLESFLKRLEQSGTSSDLDVRFSPGLIGTITSLYASQGRKSHLQTELAKAASYWRHKSKTPPISLLKAAGTALLESAKPEHLEQAGEIFSVLQTHDPNNRQATAGLVASYATLSEDKILPEHLDMLIPLDRLVAGVDAAELEDAGVARPEPSPGAVSLGAKRPQPDKEKSTRPHKIRKSRVPKDFDPGKKPDPERWLPLRDRSYYRPKGKKGKARAAGLTQGGVAAEEKPSAETEPPKGGGGGGGTAAKKKKKGKGKR